MSEFQQILKTLLVDDKLKQPFIASTPSCSYRDTLLDKLEEYANRIENLTTNGILTTWLKDHISDLREMNKKLLRSVDQYLSGSAGKAYDEIEQLMQLDIVRASLITLKMPLKRYYSNLYGSKSLYRVRVCEEYISERNDIFHIPFEKRHLVKNQRYSIAGIPCLYLGTSLYVCWEEMGKPSLDKLYLSHYKVNGESSYEEIFVLNFAFSLEMLLHQNLEIFFDKDIKEEEAKACLAIWPILIACSFNVEHSNSSFCVEYVIPNLILQWVGKEKRPVSGIMYLSTKTKQIRNYDHGINFVFPPDTDEIQQVGFCDKLKNIFLFSKPVSWQLLNTFADQIDDNSSGSISRSDDIEGQLIENYKSTKFYKMELKLTSRTKLMNML